MRQILYYVFRSVLPVLLISSCWQPLRAQDTVAVKLIVEPSVIDVCGTDKDFTLIFDIGPIKTSDSLIGYDLSFRYNPDKITFSTVLWANTLTEQMNEFMSAPIYAVKSPGLSQISATNINRPVAGNKPLVAIRGTYREECPGSAEISVDIFEASYEFKKRLMAFHNTVISAEVAAKPSRMLNLNFALDSLSTEDSLVSINSTLSLPSEKMMSEGRIKFFSNNKDFILDSINIGEGFQISQVERMQDSILLVWKRAGVGTANEIVFTINGKFTGEGDAILSAIPLVNDSCACIAGISGDSSQIRYRKISVGVEETENVPTAYIQSGTTLIIESEKLLKSIEIWSYLGEKLAEYGNIENKRAILNIGQLSGGHYFVKILDEDNSWKIKHLLYK